MDVPATAFLFLERRQGGVYLMVDPHRRYTASVEFPI